MSEHGCSHGRLSACIAVLPNCQCDVVAAMGLAVRAER